jgi:hypothetical protein
MLTPRAKQHRRPFKSLTVSTSRAMPATSCNASWHVTLPLCVP